MNAKVILFAGTSDGRRLGEKLAAQQIGVLLCVATEYGEQLIPATEGLRVHRGRLSASQMAELLRKEGRPWVVDATHPFAREASENIRSACAQTGARYLRLLRDKVDYEDAVYAGSMEEAAGILCGDDSNILLTVGSKELAAFTKVKGYRQRVYPRVLPMGEALESCERLGYAARQLICMQGPFSHEMNVATLRQVKAGWLVTKDSGTAGGMAEKASAAREAGARLLVIRRPDEEGYSMSELYRLLEKHLDIRLLEGETGKGFPRFPLFVSLEGKPAAVIGGGKIACRRVKALLQCGAQIQVIAPELAGELQTLHQQGNISWVQREYRYGDLEGMYLAVVCTDNLEANNSASGEAAHRGIPCSAAHDRERGSFWFPAFICEGNLTAGMVSTNGDHGAVRLAAGEVRKLLGGKE